ncbi:MAG: O-antigen ligase family protein [Candidatus Erginobacter occultus]|nr:O-antigen ligase family protein [Candidatus Erginobacter occultus]
MIWLLVSLAVLAALPGMMSGNYLPKIFWVALTVGIGLAILPPPRREAVGLSLLGGVWLAYLVWALLSLTWALQPRVALERWLVMLVLTLAYLLAGRTRFWESSVFWRGFSLIAGLAALIGILQYYLPSFSPANYFPGTAVPRGTMGHRNYAGMYFMVTLPFLARYYFSARGKEARLPFAALVLGMGFLLLAKTRGAWLGLAAGVVFFLAGGGGRKLYCLKLRFVLLAGTLAAAVIFVLAVRPPRSVENMMAGKADLARTARTLLDPENRLAMWREIPGVTHPLLGAGFGNFPILATPLDREGKVKTLNWEVHNDYLQAYVDLGVPGAVLFLAIFVILILLAWRGRGRGLILAAGASIVGLSVMQFTVFTMEVVSTQVWIAGVVALLNREAVGRSRKKFRRLAGIILPLNYLAALGLLLLAGVIGLTIRGDREFRRGREEFEQVIAYQEALRQPDGYPEETLDRIRRELDYARIRLQVRLRYLADRVLPKMLFDANMRHITCHQFAGLALGIDDQRAAKKFSRKALDLHPYDRTALTYLAAITLQQGRFEEAFHYLSRGLDIFGYNSYLPFFGENLARLYQARGELLRAREILERMESNRVIPPSAPVPPARTNSVPIDAVLDWEDCRGAVTYDLYLWTAGEKSEAPDPFATGIRESRFRTRSGLRPGTTYFWRINAVGRYGEAEGKLWFFRTEDTLR